MPDLPSILVVVSDDSLRRLLVRVLTMEGFEVEDVSRGIDAFRRDMAAFDLVIVRQDLADGNGIDLALALRDEKPDLGFLMITGAADFELPIPRSRVLEMPFPLRFLVEKIRELVIDRPSGAVDTHRELHGGTRYVATEGGELVGE